jgi:hypothetical protein
MLAARGCGKQPDVRMVRYKCDVRGWIYTAHCTITSFTASRNDPLHVENDGGGGGAQTVISRVVWITIGESW